MEKVICHESHSSSCSDTKMLQISEEVEDSLDWLPRGWILEIRTQNSGACAGRQKKCYFDPSTGSRFYSRKAVFHHLNPGKVCGPNMRQTRSATAKSVTECCNEINQDENMKNFTKNALVEDAPSGLPEGWIKEIRVRKGDSRKKDLFYIDQASGYTFRSLKDVFRYIETGDILRCVSRPQKRDIRGTCTIEKESRSPTAARKGDRRGDPVKKCLFATKGPDADVKKLTEIYRSPEPSSSPQWDHASTTSEEDDLNCKIPNNKILDNKYQEGLKLVSCTDFTCVDRSPEQTSLFEKENISRLQNDAAKKSVEALQTGQPRMNDECLPSVANGMKQGHGNLKDLEPLPKEKESTSSPSAVFASSNLVLYNKEKSEQKNEKPSSLKMPKRGRKKKADQAIMTPVRASKRLAALRVNASNETEMIEEKSVEPEMDKALGSSTISPLTNANSSASKPEHPTKIENLGPLSKELHSHEQFELGTLNNDKEPTFTSPFGGSWPDPCIEFAFRTLTSDIPFLDDLVAMQHYFQHQQMGSTPGPSLNHSLGNGNQGNLNQTEHLNQLNPWSEPFVPFKDDVRSRRFQQGLQSCKKVN